MFVVTPTNKTVELGGSFELECADNIGSYVQWEWIGHASLPLSFIGLNGALQVVNVAEGLNGGVLRCLAGGIVADAHITVVGTKLDATLEGCGSNPLIIS